MTDTIGPFSSVQWAQDQWYRHAPFWAPSGVYSSSDLQISFSGLNFTVGVGRAWVRGAGFERTGTPASQAIPANTNASLSRRDRVVLRRDLAAGTVAPTLIQGTPQASPTAPTVQSSDTGQWDLLLWSFLVPPNSGTSITGTVDERQILDPSTGGLLVTSGSLSLQPNYASAAGTWGAPKWVQEGNKMRLQGSVTNSATGTPFNATAGTEYQIGTVPTIGGVLMAPSDTRAYSVAYGNGSTFAAGLVVVHTDGRINFLSSTTVSISTQGVLSLSLSGIDWIVGV